MSESKNPIKVLNAFSKKIARLSDEDLENPPAPLSKDKKLQDQIKARQLDRQTYLVRKYKDFQEPLTNDIEEDEENLIKAYDFFCKLTELCEKEKAENPETQLHSLELSNPLCLRDDYTLGDSMAFLRLWFLDKYKDAGIIPEFKRAENGSFYLIFTERELWTPSSLEKEILRSLDDAESSET